MADSLLLAHTHRLAYRHECKSTSESRRQLLSGVQWRGSAPHRHICPAVSETWRASPRPPTVRLRLPPYVFTNIIFFGIVLLPFVNVAITKPQYPCLVLCLAFTTSLSRRYLFKLYFFFFNVLAVIAEEEKEANAEASSSRRGPIKELPCQSFALYQCY